MTARSLLKCCSLLWFPLWNFVTPTAVFGHATGENYVWIIVEESHFQGWFEIHFDDLRTKLELEIPQDPEEAQDFVDSIAPTVQAYIREHFSLIANGQEIPIEFTENDVYVLIGLGHYAKYHFKTPPLELPERIVIRDNLLFEFDSLHRSLIAIQYDKEADDENSGEFVFMVFSDSNSEQELDLTDKHGLLGPRDFIWQGILHIWIGFDHILFLVALLLPTVLRREDGRWVPVPSFRLALWNVVKIVTLFTIAHSITLFLAAFNFIRLPSQLVESLIALSIVIVSLNAMALRFREGTGWVIFFFGLFHGMGFASVMGHLPFRTRDLIGILFGFNVGVGIGQLVIVGGIFTLLYLLRKKTFYVPLILKGGSAVICLIATYWFVERALGL